MGDIKKGEKAAIEATLKPQKGVCSVGEGELFPETVPAEHPMPEKKGPGRPKGAKNRVTKDRIKAILARPGIKDPLEYMAEVYSGQDRDTEALSAKEKTARKVACAVALAPYMHSKKPTEVEVKEDRRVVITIGSDHADDDGLRDVLEIDALELLGDDIDEGEENG